MNHYHFFYKGLLLLQALKMLDAALAKEKGPGDVEEAAAEVSYHYMM